MWVFTFVVSSSSRFERLYLLRWNVNRARDFSSPRSPAVETRVLQPLVRAERLLLRAHLFATPGAGKTNRLQFLYRNNVTTFCIVFI
jgi:hypothetical protein